MIGKSPWRYAEEIIKRQVLEKVSRGQYSEADKITRDFVKRIYEDEISKLSVEQIKKIVHEITGGLGYKGDDWNIMRMNYVGSIISWAEIVKDGYRILEIGTGLGRTCFTILYSCDISEYVTIDISPEILAIALFKNPIEMYQKVLWDKRVRILLGDAVNVVRRIRDKFDHIVHDGGPNPVKNPRLFSQNFFKYLIKRLRKNGTLSVFAGRDPKWVDKIYRNLVLLGLRVETVTFPDTPVRVLHCIKPF